MPSPPGQEVVWTEVGFEHPLGSVTKPPPGQVLLIDGDGHWTFTPNGPWTDLYKLIELRLPGDVHPIPPGKLPARLDVPLRLTRAARDQAPSLWVLRENATAAVDQLVQNLPDEIIGRLLFAVSGEKDDPTVILRARPSQKGPPELVVNAEAYVPLLQMGNLYAPMGAILEPPLRRERVRDLLAPRPEQVAWLAPVSAGVLGRVPRRDDRRDRVRAARGLGRVRRALARAVDRAVGPQRHLRVRVVRVRGRRVDRQAASRVRRGRLRRR